MIELAHREGHSVIGGLELVAVDAKLGGDERLPLHRLVPSADGLVESIGIVKAALEIVHMAC